MVKTQLPALPPTSALKSLLQGHDDDTELFQAIVNAPFKYKLEMAFLFLGIVVLLQVNKKTGMVDRVALSNTDLAKRTTDVSYVKFDEIKVPLNYADNIIAKAINSGESLDTTDWKFLFNPAMTDEQARINQANAGIAYSVVYPLKSRDGGALIFSYFQFSGAVSDDAKTFMKTYTDLVDEALASKQ